ncbi:MAG: Rieske 2Fe-2S domain-containing protein [Nocardioidaceae bacterium]
MAERDRQDDIATPSRRAVLRGAVLAGAAIPVVAACSPGAQGTTARGGAPGGTGSAGSHAVAILKTTQVPKGGGVVDATAGVVVTQPKPGAFEGFSSTCTHMGCTLGSVSGGTINCPCHGSRFSIVDGTPVAGPAGSPPSSIPPLPKMPLKIKGNQIFLA